MQSRDILEVFRLLGLETEEQRASLRFIWPDDSAQAPSPKQSLLEIRLGNGTIRDEPITRETEK